MGTGIDDELTTLYREEAPRMWRAVFAYAHDKEVASDAVAEAFAQYLRRGSEVRSPRPWLWHTAFKIAAGDLLERGRVARTAEPEAYEMRDPDMLIHTLAALPQRQRAALVLRYYAGYEPKDIAGILGISAATVRVHLTRGRRRLRKLLEVDDER